ncbi:hypothetical protein [Pseudomonas sp. NPDC089569]|uniref:hypothetical protein n=1 Tax=Pseudomonas sp. NPDC089569 TaxID=3390722 RepID=UPI003D015F81
MSQPVLYPYHPVSGKRLSATLDFIEGSVACDIFKEDGKLVIEQGSETQMLWDTAEEQNSCAVRFLLDDDNTECLEQEALWREVDADRIEIDVPGSATTALTANTLRARLAELGSAAREVVLNAEAGQKNGDALAQLKYLLESLGLMEPVDEE